MSGWTQERAELTKAAFTDFLAHCWVKSKESGYTILGTNLLGSQQIVIDEIFDGLAHDIHNFKILKSRQLGISTIVRALSLFWNGIFDITSALIFDDARHLEDARQEMVDMLDAMDADFQFPRKRTDNRGMLVLQNKSRINLLTAGTKVAKSSKRLGAGSAVSMVHRSELCNYGNPEALESFRHSMARDNPDRLFIDESTATGYNIWHDIWMEGKEDPHCRCIFIGWWSHAKQRIVRDHPDFKIYTAAPLSEEEKEKIAQVKELYGVSIDAEQLAWIRKEMDPASAKEEDGEVDYSGNALRLQEQAWCVTTETRVGTSFGLLRIDDVRSGADATLGKVLHVEQTGVEPIWSARTKKGYRVRGTGNHPLINQDGEKTDLALSLGHIVRLQPPRFADEVYFAEWRQGPVVSRVEVTPDFARLIGLFMGDGSISGGSKNGGAGYFKITCDMKDMDVVDECARLLTDIFGVTPGIVKQPSNCIDVKVGSKLIVETFRALGMTRNDTGPTRRKIHVPDFIWRSPKHVVREFLRGLFEADGFVGENGNRVAFFSKYKDFVQDVQLLLLGFGVTSSFSSMEKKAGDGHIYTGTQLELRTQETRKFSEEIGFISARKAARSNSPRLDPSGRKSLPIVFHDQVVEVVNEDVTEPVWNMTVEGEHLFDANGILTHNTEFDAFQNTGSTFFSGEALTDQSNKHVSSKFEAFFFTPGFDFGDMRVYTTRSPKQVQCKVWEHPVQDSCYIVGADPAYGRSAKSDRSCIQVLRAYSDGLDQVAEYAWQGINSQQLAWVIVALEAWYGADNSEIYRIVEVNGPGDATLRELHAMKQKIATGYFQQQGYEGLQDIQRNVRNYFYTRADAVTVGNSALHVKTTEMLKVSMLERLRDFTENGMLRLRSQASVDEMRSITREGDSIEAEGAKKDDRVMGLAFAVRMWDDRVRRKLMQGRRTREAEAAKRRRSVVDQVKLYNESTFNAFMASKQRQRQNAALSAMRSMRWGGRR